MKTREEKKASYYDSNMTEKNQNAQIIPLRTKKPQTMKKHNESVKSKPNINTTAKFALQGPATARNLKKPKMPLPHLAVTMIQDQ